MGAAFGRRSFSGRRASLARLLCRTAAVGLDEGCSFCTAGDDRIAGVRRGDPVRPVFMGDRATGGKNDGRRALTDRRKSAGPGAFPIRSSSKLHSGRGCRIHTLVHRHALRPHNRVIPILCHVDSYRRSLGRSLGRREDTVYFFHAIFIASIFFERNAGPSS